MNKILIPSVAITLLYIVVEFLRQKFIFKHKKPLKELVTDGLVVLVSSVIGLYGIEYLDCGVLKKNTPSAFTGTPEF